jgi:hypothetical protein
MNASEAVERNMKQSHENHSLMITIHRHENEMKNYQSEIHLLNLEIQSLREKMKEFHNLQLIAERKSTELLSSNNKLQGYYDDIKQQYEINNLELEKLKSLHNDKNNQLLHYQQLLSSQELKTKDYDSVSAKYNQLQLLLQQKESAFQKEVEVLKQHRELSSSELMNVQQTLFIKEKTIEELNKQFTELRKTHEEMISQKELIQQELISMENRKNNEKLHELKNELSSTLLEFQEIEKEKQLKQNIILTLTTNLEKEKEKNVLMSMQLNLLEEKIKVLSTELSVFRGLDVYHTSMQQELDYYKQSNLMKSTGPGGGGDPSFFSPSSLVALPLSSSSGENKEKDRDGQLKFLQARNNNLMREAAAVRAKSPLKPVGATTTTQQPLKPSATMNMNNNQNNRRNSVPVSYSYNNHNHARPQANNNINSSNATNNTSEENLPNMSESNGGDNEEEDSSERNKLSLEDISSVQGDEENEKEMKRQQQYKITKQTSNDDDHRRRGHSKERQEQYEEQKEGTAGGPSQGDDLQRRKQEQQRRRTMNNNDNNDNREKEKDQQLDEWQRQQRNQRILDDSSSSIAKFQADVSRYHQLFPQKQQQSLKSRSPEKNPYRPFATTKVNPSSGSDLDKYLIKERKPLSSSPPFNRNNNNNNLASSGYNHGYNNASSADFYCGDHQIRADQRAKRKETREKLLMEKIIMEERQKNKNSNNNNALSPKGNSAVPSTRQPPTVDPFELQKQQFRRSVSPFSSAAAASLAQPSLRQRSTDALDTLYQPQTSRQQPVSSNNNRKSVSLSTLNNNNYQRDPNYMSEIRARGMNFPDSRFSPTRIHSTAHLMNNRLDLDRARKLLNLG